MLLLPFVQFALILLMMLLLLRAILIEFFILLLLIALAERLIFFGYQLFIPIISDATWHGDFIGPNFCLFHVAIFVQLPTDLALAKQVITLNGEVVTVFT